MINNNGNHGPINRSIDFITNFLGSPLAVAIHLLFISSWFFFHLPAELLIYVFTIEGVFIWLFVIHTTNKLRDFEWKKERWERRRDRDKLEEDIRITEKDLRLTQEVYKKIHEIHAELESVKEHLQNEVH